jgi:flagellar hook-associated protein 2
MATSGIFSGNSRFSADFLSVISRSVAIASLPLNQLNSQKTAFAEQQKSLTSLDSLFTSFQSTITGLETSATSSLLSSSVSDNTIASASVSAGALPGSYGIEVVGLGSYTNTLSKAALPVVTNPSSTSISTSGSYTLTIDGTPFTITPSSNTLSALAEAINNKDGVDADATIINTGTAASPSYKLSITSTKLKAATIQLNDGSIDLLDTLSTGANGSYKVNGGAAIATESRTVTIGPSFTADLLKVGTATVTVSKGTGVIGNSLSALVNAFNAAVDELDKHRGQNKGALAGESLVPVLSQALRGIAGYGNITSGPITDLPKLGLTFTAQGKLTFDSAAFSTATSGQIDNLIKFLGSSTTSGFIKTSLDTLKSVQDATTGTLKVAITNANSLITDHDSRIAEVQDRVDKLRDRLNAQMAVSDALIASLEQKASYFTSLFESMRVSSRMYSG